MAKAELTGIETELNDTEEGIEDIEFERITILLPKDMKNWLMKPSNHHGEKGSTVIRGLIREKMESIETEKLAQAA